jgi:hypothetical protein
MKTFQVKIGRRWINAWSARICLIEGERYLEFQTAMGSFGLAPPDKWRIASMKEASR